MNTTSQKKKKKKKSVSNIRKHLSGKTDYFVIQCLHCLTFFTLVICSAARCREKLFFLCWKVVYRARYWSYGNEEQWHSSGWGRYTEGLWSRAECPVPAWARPSGAAWGPHWLLAGVRARGTLELVFPRESVYEVILTQWVGLLDLVLKAERRQKSRSAAEVLYQLGELLSLLQMEM